MDPQPALLSSERTKINVVKGLIRELRPKQWTKNLLVFASAMFAGTLLEPENLLRTMIAFVAFSFMSSTIYIINDIIDVDKDRLHPDKCHRPIASGVVSIPLGIVTATILAGLSIIASLIVNIYLTGILLVYFLLNLSYSLHLKHIVLIDVMVIAAGFVLRATAGAAAVDGHLTSWFVLCTMLLSLFLALGKRRHELELFEDQPDKRRKVLDHYSVKLLDQLMVIVTGLTIMFYALYAASEDQRMMWSVPFVIYGVFRYYYLIHMKNAGGRPEDVLLTDKHILITVVLFGAVVIYIKQFS